MLAMECPLLESTETTLPIGGNDTYNFCDEHK